MLVSKTKAKGSIPFLPVSSLILSSFGGIGRHDGFKIHSLLEVSVQVRE